MTTPFAASLLLAVKQDCGCFIHRFCFVTLDSDMVLHLAIANAKAHYRHEDAPVYGQQLERYLRNLKGAGLGNKRFVRRTGKERDSFDHHFYNHIRHVHADD